MLLKKKNYMKSNLFIYLMYWWVECKEHTSALNTPILLIHPLKKILNTPLSGDNT